MYNAPAVTYPVGRSFFQAGLTLLVALAGAVAQGAWWWQSGAHRPVQALALVLWLVFCGLALWRGLRTPAAKLVWDGHDWRLQGGASSLAVTPQVVLDVQHSLLLRLRPESGLAVWVWPAQQAQPARWLALRRALFNPAARPDPARLTALPEA